MRARSSTLLALMALALVAPTALTAQVEFGVKGGVSFGNISNKGVLPGDLHDRTGFAAGAAVDWLFIPIGIGVEALIAQRGVTSDVPGAERKLDYIDIPVYAKFQIPIPAIAPFAYIGPQISFELRCRDDDDDCPDVGRAKTDYAGIIGAGVKIGSINEFGITIEGRYIYGLRDLNISTITSDESFKTRSFLILAGLSF